MKRSTFIGMDLHQHSIDLTLAEGSHDGTITQFEVLEGMKEGARSSQVVVFRRINTDTAEVKLLNLKSIRSTADLENDLTLQPGDMVFVPRDKISKIERFMKLASVAAFMAPRL